MQCKDHSHVELWVRVKRDKGPGFMGSMITAVLTADLSTNSVGGDYGLSNPSTTCALFNQSAIITHITQTSSASKHYHSLPPSPSDSLPPSLLLCVFKAGPAGDYRPTVLVFLLLSPAGNLYDRVCS